MRLLPISTGLFALSILMGLVGCKGEETSDAQASVSTAPVSNLGTTPGTPAEASVPSPGKATVVKAEVIPVNEGLPKDNKTIPHFQVIWEWKNDGTTPIGTLKGDVRAFDKDGTITYEAKDQLLFAKYEETEAVAPGATMKIERGQGHSMTELKAGDPVRAEVGISSAGPVTKIPG